jgi:hypothetical protein
MKAFSYIRPYLVKQNKSFKYARKQSTSTIEATIETCTGPLPTVNTPHIVNTADWKKWPVFRIMDTNGKIVEGAEEPKIEQEQAFKMYQTMVRIQYLDEILYNAQRQGRISFYMQASGEEAIHIGNLLSLTFFK